jgi:hypothetical protein
MAEACFEIKDILGGKIDYASKKPIIFMANIENLHWNLIRVVHEPHLRYASSEVQVFEPMGYVFLLILCRGNTQVLLFNFWNTKFAATYQSSTRGVFVSLGNLLVGMVFRFEWSQELSSAGSIIATHWMIRRQRKRAEKALGWTTRSLRS